MTSPEKSAQHAVPPEQLADKLLELLAVKPNSTNGLAALTGYTRDTVYTRLMDLSRAGCARREKCQDSRHPGVEYTWFTTGAPRPQHTTEAGSGARRIGRPHQVTVKDYPAVGRRDPLVAFIHGPAGRTAP